MLKHSSRSLLFHCYCPSKPSAKLWHGVDGDEAFAWLRLGVAVWWSHEFKRLHCHNKSELLLWLFLSKHQRWPPPHLLNHTAPPTPPRSLDPVPNCGIKQMGPGCLLSSDWGHSEAAVTRADLSLPCLVASQHPHIFHKWSLGLSRLSSCPSSSPSSQVELSPLWRTPGLGHTVCSSTYSLLRTRVYPCMHPFFLSPLPGAQVPTQCHSFHPTQLQGDLSCSLRLCRSSYARLQ